jgi:predicted lipid-binding transport protein (Tim44 family)
MNDSSASVAGIIIFAAIAVFLLLRLRAVLGRRTGEESERGNPLDRPPPVTPLRPGLAGQPGTAVRMPALIEHDPTAPQSLDARLKRVQQADANFDEKHFLAGAKTAFQTIVQAFAAGDLATLRPLLSSHLYGEFGRAISERPRRAAAGAIVFEGPIEAEIVDARATGGDVQIQVRIASRQRHPEEAAAEDEVIDLWTFARDPRSRDPNWHLIETAIGE